VGKATLGKLSSWKLSHPSSSLLKLMMHYCIKNVTPATERSTKPIPRVAPVKNPVLLVESLQTKDNTNIMDVVAELVMQCLPVSKVCCLNLKVER
jgi:hypothetical protein